MSFQHTDSIALSELEGRAPTHSDLESRGITSSKEKDFKEDVKETVADSPVDSDVLIRDGVQRKLGQRHIQMIAIAGTIGTGLFLGSGGALHTAGPLGALLAYVIVGTVTYSMICSLGEMTSFAPISGTFPHYAARWVDPALGFAVGWNFWYQSVTSIPTEITAATILLTFWDENINNQKIYTAVICVAVISINIFGVRAFGESEFIFSIIKILLIIALLIAGLIIDLGGGPSGERIGFRYWRNPGPFNRAGLVESNIATDQFLAFVQIFVQAAFSFGGMEAIAIAASETESPRRNVAKAIGRVFWRILIFYVFGILMIGMLVAYDDPALLTDTGNAAQSPFVIAMDRAGVKVFPHIINAAVFTSAFSAGNTTLYSSSRILYGLALRGQAPRFLTYCTKRGLPLFAVLISSSFAFLSFMRVSKGSEGVFEWLVNIVTIGSLISWLTINVTFLFFRRGMIAQGIDMRKNVYHNRYQPWLALWGVLWLSMFILVNGYAVFFQWNTTDFLVAYINIPIFAALYFGYKIIMRTKIWKPHEMDLITGIPSIEETELPREPPHTIGGKIAAVLF
ncbi:general amino acid permease 1 [Dendrothele bispora CBS 962.96]|uniref:General amino acid permease 1 n=1 Tax=Dendrothele bispora (strain CBS 962.96) TaxID=1314807 RepID=A0A4S8LP91_DENBC|nr:general amino acid permease 1 [Dendrothele bispora CBS 962.96]